MVCVWIQNKCYLYEIFSSVREVKDDELVNDVYNYLGYSLYDESVKDELEYFEGIVCFLGAGNIDKEFNRIKKTIKG